MLASEEATVEGVGDASVDFTSGSIEKAAVVDAIAGCEATGSGSMEKEPAVVVFDVSGSIVKAPAAEILVGSLISGSIEKAPLELDCTGGALFEREVKAKNDGDFGLNESRARDRSANIFRTCSLSNGEDAFSSSTSLTCL